MLSPSSFQFVTPDQIEHAKETYHRDHLLVCRNSTGAPRRRSSLRDGCESWTCAWAPDLSYLAWSAGHRLVHLVPWDASRQTQQNPADTGGQAPRKYHVIECGEIVHGMAFGQTTNTIHNQGWKRQRCDHHFLVLATGHPSGQIKLWDCETATLLVEILDHKDIVHDLHFTPDNSLRLASASRDGTLKLWEFDQHRDCNLYLTIRTGAKHAFTCCWSPDTKYLASAGSSKTAALYRVERRKVLRCLRFDGHHHDVVHCSFSPDGALLATASFDTRVIIWDVYTQAKLAQLGHLHPSPRPIYAGGANDHYVYSVKFAPDGSRLASVGEDGYVRIWQFPDVSDPVTIAMVTGARCCAFSADGQLLAVGRNSGSLAVLSTPRGGAGTLAHLCRSVIRSRVPSPNMPSLPVPASLQKYLAYQDITDCGNHEKT